MPGMRGYDVAQRVAGSRPEIQFLYMSGYAEEALLGQPAFAARVVEKPFAVDTLALRIREALEPRRRPTTRARMPAHAGVAQLVEHQLPS